MSVNNHIPPSFDNKNPISITHSPIGDIPQDMLGEIFSHLSALDLFRSNTVSKKWNKAVKHYKDINFHQTINIKDQALQALFECSHPFVNTQVHGTIVSFKENILVTKERNHQWMYDFVNIYPIKGQSRSLERYNEGPIVSNLSSNQLAFLRRNEINIYNHQTQTISTLPRKDQLLPFLLLEDRMVLANQDQTKIAIYDLKGNSIAEKQVSKFSQIAFDGTYFAILGTTRNITFLDAELKEIKTETSLSVAPANIKCLLFTIREGKLYVFFENGANTIYNLSKNQQDPSISLNNAGTFRSAAIHKQILAIVKEGDKDSDIIEIWDLKKGILLHQLQPGQPVHSVALSERSTGILELAAIGKKLQIWSPHIELLTEEEQFLNKAKRSLLELAHVINNLSLSELTLKASGYLSSSMSQLFR